MIWVQKKLVAVGLLAFCVQGCSIESGSLIDELELPTFGSDDDGQALDVPPGLDLPESKDDYDIASIRESGSSAMMASRILPQRLNMRLRSESNIAWLAVGATPDSLWSHLISFWRSYGFEITDENMLHGRITTDWREQKVNVATGLRVRDMFQMRVERSPNAVTNIYLANRKAEFLRDHWQTALSDHEIEIDILNDLIDYLASRSDVKEVEISPLERVQLELDVKDLNGVPVLAIGQQYSQVWRRLGVTLDRAGLNVRKTDRSRGIYLIRYRHLANDDMIEGDGDSIAKARLLQIRLLSKGDKTFVTVHKNRKQSATLDYETAHDVLHRIVLRYKGRA